MKNTETKNTENQTKTYLVYQNIYSVGKYDVYDPTNEFSDKPKDKDIAIQFEVEEGAEWYEYISYPIYVKRKDFEAAGLNVEEVSKLRGEELFNAMCKIHPNIEKEFYPTESQYHKCGKNSPNRADYFEYDEFDDEYSCLLEVKYKFAVVEGEFLPKVEVERVK